jgi:hypothetical protein
LILEPQAAKRTKQKCEEVKEEEEKEKKSLQACTNTAFIHPLLHSSASEKKSLQACQMDKCTALE